MTRVPKTASLSGMLDQYAECPECGADLDKLKLGGVGTWRNTIQCLACGKIQRGIPFRQVICPLLAERYPNIPDSARAEAIMNEAQKDYEAAVAEQTSWST